MNNLVDQLIEKTATQREMADGELDQHPDQIALNRVYASLQEHGLNEQAATDIVSDMGNRGVVFRMAKWWVENYYEADNTGGVVAALTNEAKAE